MRGESSLGGLKLEILIYQKEQQLLRVLSQPSEDSPIAPLSSRRTESSIPRF